MSAEAPAARTVRRDLLVSCGVPSHLIDELLEYGVSPGASVAVPPLPLADEPHVEAWLRYEQDAARQGAFPALVAVFVQLRVPISEGISRTEAYRRATLQGRFDEIDEPPLVLRAPREMTLDVRRTVVGRVPVLTVADRRDFETLVQAFTERNEPVPVSPAMGACLVRGLNNWDRVARHRRAWESSPEPREPDTWADEFRRLAARKELYQDRLVVLSSGPYSAVSAAEAGVDTDDWLSRSLIIRREHELTHYATYRVFGTLRSHLLDELVADFVGLMHAFGHYPERLALRFMGLDTYPHVREDARLEVYRGAAGLSDEGMSAACQLAVRCARSLSAIADARLATTADLAEFGRLTLALASLSLEELASDEAVRFVRARLAS